jgi:hypothetical protein
MAKAKRYRPWIYRPSIKLRSQDDENAIRFVLAAMAFEMTARQAIALLASDEARKRTEVLTAVNEPNKPNRTR